MLVVMPGDLRLNSGSKPPRRSRPGCSNKTSPVLCVHCVCQCDPAVCKWYKTLLSGKYWYLYLPATGPFFSTLMNTVRLCVCDLRRSKLDWHRPGVFLLDLKVFICCLEHYICWKNDGATWEICCAWQHKNMEHFSFCILPPTNKPALPTPLFASHIL